MKEDNMEKLLDNDFSLYSLTVKSANADLKETGRNFHYRGKDLRSLIMLLRKRFSSIEPQEIRLVRQIPKNTAAAEAIVVNTPNAQTFLCFGSQKFREQLEEAVYVAGKVETKSNCEETRSEQNPVSMYSGSYVRSLQSSSGK